MSTQRMLITILAAGAVLLAVGIGPRFTGSARALPQAQAGITIPYSGRLSDEAGGPVADGAYDFTFALYAAESGGEPLWTEMQEGVTVQGGAFAVILGSVASLPQEVLDGGARWLEVGVRGPGEAAFTLLSPRQELSAAGPTARASAVAPANGLSCWHTHWGETWTGSGNGLVLVSSDGHGVIGRSGATSGSGVYGFTTATSGIGVYGYASAAGGPTYGVYGMSASTEGRGVYGYASATSGINQGVHGESRSLSGYGVYGTAPSYGVYGYATSTSSTNYGVRGVSNSPFGYGVYGSAPTYGVRGYTTATSGETYGVYGQSVSTDGYGVFGLASATNGFNSGVYGESASSVGTGVVGLASANSGITLGVYGRSNSPGGYGVYGLAFATSGTNHGVYGESRSTDGYGVYGYASATNGGNHGVWGQSDSTNGYGVYGYAYAISGTNYGVFGVSRSTSGYGVYGAATATSGTNIGVAGISYSLSGYAGYFMGKVRVTGLLEKPGGGFKIDHPLDPANKYLNHSFVESPDMMNIYNGNVTLDENGEAWVQLPEWFQALNQDFRYQLTPIGAPMPNLYIAQRIQGNRFKIAGGVPGMEVSWQVTGIRHDPFADRNRIPVEEEKPAEERGTYLYPEGYGQPQEKGLDYQRNPELFRPLPTAPAPQGNK